MKIRITQLFLFVCIALAAASAAFAADTDRDGLSDDVEQALGSSPLHRDIFVEIDWLVVSGRNLKPRPGFTQIVESIFASAPLSNPDGTTGIRIHLELSTAIKTTDAVLGNMSPINGDYNWAEFDSIKQQFFTPSKRNTHHYVVFVRDVGDTDGHASGISGLSRNGLANFKAGASDFIVALGGQYWFNYPNAPEYKWTQAGTFVHELGHNLGLRHGGVDHTTYKPNLMSVMSYSYQTDGIPYTYNDGSRVYTYDYSRKVLPPLNENKLNEANGMGAAARDSEGVFGARWTQYDGSKWAEAQTFNASSNVDWDQNGAINSGVKTNLNQDVVFDSNGNAFHKLSNLTGFEEWSKLTYNGGFIGKAASTVLPAATTIRCLDAAQHQKLNRSSRIDAPRRTREK